LDISGPQLDGDCFVSRRYEHSPAHHTPLRSSTQTCGHRARPDSGPGCDTPLHTPKYRGALEHYDATDQPEWSWARDRGRRAGSASSRSRDEFVGRHQEVYREWRKIVVQYNISGVQVHDARLAAAMYVHSVGNILTLNVADFSRFAGLSAIHPGTI
jgi:hypothetical protein